MVNSRDPCILYTDCVQRSDMVTITLIKLTGETTVDTFPVEQAFLQIFPVMLMTGPLEDSLLDEPLI